MRVAAPRPQIAHAVAGDRLADFPVSVKTMSRFETPKQQRAVMEHNYEWFAKYIWGEETQAATATK